MLSLIKTVSKNIPGLDQCYPSFDKAGTEKTNGAEIMKNMLCIADFEWRWFSFTMGCSKVNLRCTTL